MHTSWPFAHKRRKRKDFALSVPHVVVVVALDIFLATTQRSLGAGDLASNQDGLPMQGCVRKVRRFEVRPRQ